MDAFMFTNPDITEKDADDAIFLTIATQVFSCHNLKFGRDWIVDEHMISITKEMSHEERLEIAQEIDDILA